jgi:hypothetical protein
MKRFLILLLCAHTLGVGAGPLGSFYTKTPEDAIYQIYPDFKIYSTQQNGVRIHSFVDTNQKLVAIAWEGVATPDLSTLLPVQSLENDPNLVVRRTQQGRLRKGVAYLLEASNTPQLLTHPLLGF